MACNEPALFARQPCSRCLGPVSADELVMFAHQHVYHVDCFVCTVCQRRLTTGQQYGMQHGAVFCQTHYSLVVNGDSPNDDVTSQAPHGQLLHPTAVTPGEYMPNDDDYDRAILTDVQQVPVCSAELGPPNDAMSMTLSPPPAYTLLDGHRTTPIHQHSTPSDAISSSVRSTLHGQASYYNGTGMSQKGRPRKRCKVSLQTERSPLHTSDSDPYTGSNFGDMNFSDMVGCDLELLRHGGMAAYGRLKDGSGEMSGNGCGRQKRLRTSFKHHQLRSMKAYFALNHNPDAKDLKELAQKTGLTKRVLQVWFQNARAKYRRTTLKQEQQQQDRGGQSAPTDANGSNGVTSSGGDGKSSIRSMHQTMSLSGRGNHQHPGGSARISSSSGGMTSSSAGAQRGYLLSTSSSHEDSLSDVSSTMSLSNEAAPHSAVGSDQQQQHASLALTSGATGAMQFLANMDRRIGVDVMSSEKLFMN